MNSFLKSLKVQASFFLPIWLAVGIVSLFIYGMMHMALNLPEWDIVESTPAKVEVFSVQGSKYGYINYRIPGLTETHAQRMSGKYAARRFQNIQFPVTLDVTCVKYKLRDSNPAKYDFSYPDLQSQLEKHIP